MIVTEKRCYVCDAPAVGLLCRWGDPAEGGGYVCARHAIDLADSVHKVVTGDHFGDDDDTESVAEAGR